jgi:hypothetical protein
VGATGGIGERYATQVGALWTGLARTLAQLERLAADPAGLDDEDARDSLKQLQYRLHVASEDAYGISPPSGIEPVHAELAAALAGARDATAELVEALEDDGLEAALLCLHEWRGALFRVRLARLRLTVPVPTSAPAAAPTAAAAAVGVRSPLLALLLVIVGATAFVGGATLDTWPLWAAGLTAVGGAFISYKP